MESSQSTSRVILVLLMAVAPMLGVTACPEPADIEPCICYNDTYGYQLECGNVTSTAQLNSIFASNFPEKTFNTLQIFNSSIDAITALPSGVTFDYIELENIVNLSEISAEAFADSYSTLKLFRANITSLRNLSFLTSELPNYVEMQSIHVYHSPIEVLDSWHSTSLFLADISYTNLKSIPPGELY